MGARLVTAALVRVWVTLFLGAQVPNVFVLAPHFLGSRGHDEQQIGVVMGAYGIASLVCMPLVSWATGRWGYARILAGGCAVAAAGALVFDAAGGLPGYALGRVLQGAGFSAVLVGGAAYVAETAPLDRLGQALGMAGVLTLTAQAVGPVIGRIVLETAGWPWVFRTGAIAGALGTLVALGLPPVAARPPAPEDARLGAGGAIAATALAAVGYGAIWTFLADYAPRAGVTDPNYFFVAYMAAAVSTRLFLGRLSDRIGRRQAAAPALLGHAAILLAMARLGAAWQAVVIGLVFGLCHGVYYPTVQALIVERSSGGRTKAVAASSFAFGLGMVVAAYGLGPVARAAGYPAIYVVASAAGALAAALVWWKT